MTEVFRKKVLILPKASVPNPSLATKSVKVIDIKCLILQGVSQKIALDDQKILIFEESERDAFIAVERLLIGTLRA